MSNSDSKEAQVIYFGGTIVTMDDDRPEVEAVAVANGQIIATGQEDYVTRTKTDDTILVDLQGDPEQQYVFQPVGKRWSIEPIGPWKGKVPSSNLVMIGTPNSIDDEWLYQKMHEAELLNG
jgi:hypothetical protein